MGETRKTIESLWQACAGRDWETFGSLLAPDVVYECPQTRERVRGREAYVRFNREFPGDWTASAEAFAAEERRGVSRMRFELEGEVMTGIAFITVDAQGLIDSITDYWPDPYEPPADRAHLVERY
jgi:SnoaL-like domain